MSIIQRKVYSGVDNLPNGHASNNITKGCIVLEGGAFRGLYTQGVTDALKEADINLQCTVGVSAGAMDGMHYVTGQIGRSARINLKHRHDSNYVGLKAFRKNAGIIGFEYLFGKLEEEDPLDKVSLYNKDKRFIVVATDYVTGKTKYFDRDTCSNLEKAIQASASMPYVSRPVKVDGRYYLDGGCSNAIPYKWAMDEGYEKIVVVRTRPLDYRKEVSEQSERMALKYYHKTPAFAKTFSESEERYNRQCEELINLKNEGKIFVIAPSVPIHVQRVEGDMEKLGELYYIGYNDALACIEELNKFLNKK